MGQEEILVLLQKHKEMTRPEIQEVLGLSRPAICQALKQLAKYGEIDIVLQSNSPIRKYKLRNGY